MKEKATAADKTEKTEKKKSAVFNANEKNCEIGLVKIHENVVSSLVRKAVCMVEGVTRLAGSSFVDNIAEIVGSRKISDRAISIAMGEDAVEIEVKINIAYGYTIPDVAERVQRTVIEQVEKTTGMNVRQVNVLVQEMEEKCCDEDDAEEQEEGFVQP